MFYEQMMQKNSLVHRLWSSCKTSIVHQSSHSYTQQNSITERKNRHLLEVAHTLNSQKSS